MAAAVPTDRSAVTLLCPVRGCGLPLGASTGGVACARGHHFDRARSGYLNLLQPQDRRSATPGDSPTAAEARRRLYDAGHGAELLAALRRLLAALDLPPRPAVLDVGCGEGTPLGDLAASRPLEGHGVDLSTAAIELAARRFPALTWVVANADRFLPYPDGTFDVVLALSSRLKPAELARVLAPAGRLLVATPAADDLVELRAALYGQGPPRDRLERAIATLAPAFALAARTTVRRRAPLDAAAVRDALVATYRGGRPSEAARREELGAMVVTMSHDLATFRHRG